MTRKTTRATKGVMGTTMAPKSKASSNRWDIRKLFTGVFALLHGPDQIVLVGLSEVGEHGRGLNNGR